MELYPYQPCSEPEQYAPGTTGPLCICVAEGFGVGLCVGGFVDGRGAGAFDAAGTGFGDGETGAPAVGVGEAVAELVAEGLTAAAAVAADRGGGVEPLQPATRRAGTAMKPATAIAILVRREYSLTDIIAPYKYQ